MRKKTTIIKTQKDMSIVALWDTHVQRAQPTRVTEGGCLGLCSDKAGLNIRLRTISARRLHRSSLPFTMAPARHPVRVTVSGYIDFTLEVCVDGASGQCSDRYAGGLLHNRLVFPLRYSSSPFVLSVF